MEIFYLRLATIADAEKILDIYAPYITDTCVSFEEKVPSLQEFTLRMAKIIDVYPYLVMTSESGDIIGFAYAAPHMSRAAYRWNVETSIYLHRDMRGLGLGSKLYKALFGLLTLQGVENAYACIVYPYDESISFHEHMGFTKVGHFHGSGFKMGEWHDIVWYEKKLGRGVRPSKNIISVKEINNEDMKGILKV